MKQFVVFLFAIGLLVTACYHGHGLSSEPEEGWVRGQITFVGTWPDTTLEVRLAVLSGYPQGITDAGELYTFVLEHLVMFSDTIPRFVETYDYELLLPSDYYPWIVVVWFPDVENHLSYAKELGAYYENPDDALPASFNVYPESVTEGIDITADFANLERENSFFKKQKENE